MAKNINSQAKQFGLRVRQIRKNAGLTQQQFADSLGMKHANISGIENGSTNPKLSFFFKIKEIYNVSMDYLLMGREQHSTLQLQQQKNLQRQQVNDIKNIHDFYWFMEHSSVFRVNMIAQGTLFLHVNEDVIKRNIDNSRRVL